MTPSYTNRQRPPATRPGWFGGVPTVQRDPEEHRRVLRSFGFSEPPFEEAEQTPAGLDPTGLRALKSFIGDAALRSAGSRKMPRPRTDRAPLMSVPHAGASGGFPNSNPLDDRLEACACYDSAEAWFEAEYGAVAGEPNLVVCGDASIFVGASFEYEASGSPIAPGSCVPVAECEDRREAAGCCDGLASVESWGQVDEVCERIGPNWGAGAAPYVFLDLIYAGDGYCWVSVMCNANDGSEDVKRWGLVASDPCSPPAEYPTLPSTFPGLFECGNLPGEEPLGPYPNPPSLRDEVEFAIRHDATDARVAWGCLRNWSSRTLQGSRSTTVAFPQQEVQITNNGLCQDFDLDFAQDCSGRWYKIGMNDAITFDDGGGGCEIHGAKCRIRGTPWTDDSCE